MAAPDTKVILALASEIEEAKAHLEGLQAKWLAFFSPVTVAEATPATPSPAAPSVKKTRGANASSLAGRIVNLLNVDPQCHYEAGEIAKELGEPADKVQRTINKLVFKKRIGRYSRGLYESINQG